MAQLTTDVTDARFEKTDHESVMAWLLRSDSLMHRLKEGSESAGSDQVVGRVISFRVADGNAHYQVMSEDPLRLRHIPYGEGYQISVRRMAEMRVEDVYEMACVRARQRVTAEMAAERV